MTIDNIEVIFEEYDIQHIIEEIEKEEEVDNLIEKYHIEDMIDLEDSLLKEIYKEDVFDY